MAEREPYAQSTAMLPAEPGLHCRRALGLHYQLQVTLLLPGTQAKAVGG